MQILLIRHSHAEAREEWNDKGNPDNLRPLTKRGINRACDAVAGLSRFIPNIDHIYSSQYTRSIQTAEVLHGQFKAAELTIIKHLNPQGPSSKLKTIIKKHKADSTIAFVGHQPELTFLLSELLGSDENLSIRLKKGGVALLKYQEDTTQLQWLLTQRQLCYLSHYD